MADIKAKWVRIYSPGGVTVNYQGQAGLTRPMVVSVTNIEKFIERGATVEEIKADETTVLLTKDNFDKDNGGIAVDTTAQFAGDIEEEHTNIRKAIQSARIKRIEDEMFRKDKDSSSKTLTVMSVDPVANINAAKDSTVESLKLPKTVDVLLSDSSVKSLGVTWDTSTVSLGASGTFTAKGTLTLVDGVENPSNVKASVKIVVA